MSSNLFVDKYQISMAYAYWKQNRHNLTATFEVLIRKCPFGGEFLVYAGLSDVLEYITNFKFTESDIKYLSQIYPDITKNDPEFLIYLANLDWSNIKVQSLVEGTITSARIPLLILTGPIAILQIMETAVLNLINFASLITTNTVRYRLAIGLDSNIKMMEFGARRAQGEGAMLASKYTYVGGCDATSNLMAGNLYGIPVAGTQAHSFVSSHYKSKHEFHTKSLVYNGKVIEPNFVERVYKKKEWFLINKIAYPDHLFIIKSELNSMIDYAISFPFNFSVLIDTYSTLQSGVYCFLIVVLSLLDCFKSELSESDFNLYYQSFGVRIDSGDLAFCSDQIRRIFHTVSQDTRIPLLSKINIIASSNISEEVLWSIRSQTHSIDAYGIGTNLVTCYNQPALGGVYKLVDVDSQPVMKLSESIEKVTLPGKKKCYRLFNSDHVPTIDLMLLEDEPTPKDNQKILCQHPFVSQKKAYFTPSLVEPLHITYVDNHKLLQKIPSIEETRHNILDQLRLFREDHLRHMNATPYKVSVSQKLYKLTHQMWDDLRPIAVLE